VIKAYRSPNVMCAIKIKENMMGRACSTYDRLGEVHTGILWGKPEGKKPLGNLSADERMLLKCALKQ